MKKHEFRQPETKREVVRIGGLLKEVTTILDVGGNVLHRVVQPIMVEFKAHDMLQVIIGAMLLAIPISFTEEVWRLGATLPIKNILLLAGLSVLFVGLFVYHNFYRHHKFSQHYGEFIKRILSIYFFSLIVVGSVLTIIQQAPWGTDVVLALKRTIIVALPASLSAAIADMIK